ncbi:hypothetical protein [Nocardia wallacei]|uniref:hypothetical protein n=1 Tax=Nocardia wallacei TaxID=480035 RepID=UPI0024577D02|nr:hypothetical protein [Nocardia wallacei]
MTMSMRQVSSIEEWAAFAEEVDEPEAVAVGQLADEVRARFGVNKHVLVGLRGEVESYEPSCDCCGVEIECFLLIECGEHRKRFNTWDGLRLGSYFDWLDEPRRQAEQAAAEKARREAAKAVMDAQIDGLVDALESLDPEGVLPEAEWAEAFDARFGGRS